MLKALADVLGEPADALRRNTKVDISDTELLHKFSIIQDLKGETKKLVDNFLDMVIRDHITGKAHAAAKHST